MKVVEGSFAACIGVEVAAYASHFGVYYGKKIFYYIHVSQLNEFQ